MPADDVSDCGFHFLVGYAISVRDTEEFAPPPPPPRPGEKKTPKTVSFMVAELNHQPQKKKLHEDGANIITSPPTNTSLEVAVV